MRPWSALAETASELRVPLSLVLKSELGRVVLGTTSAVPGLVLQGGGAVHHVFGSPRFSADLDFAQGADFDGDRMAAALEAAAESARDAWGACAVEGPASKGRLHRHKLRVALDRGTALVLAVERYEVPVHEPETRPVAGGVGTVRVESPAEIIADKAVASVDRLVSRGALKLRDVFDIAFLMDLGRPGRSLLRAKLRDYGYPEDLGPLDRVAESLDAVAAVRLREELRDVLPRPFLDGFDTSRAVLRVRDLFAELSR